MEKPLDRSGELRVNLRSGFGSAAGEAEKDERGGGQLPWRRFGDDDAFLEPQVVVGWPAEGVDNGGASAVGVLWRCSDIWIGSNGHRTRCQ